MGTSLFDTREVKMAKQTDNITLFPKPTRLPLNDFIMQVQKYGAQLTSIHLAVASAQKLFSEGGDIWPDQCNRIIDSIQTMDEPVQEFSPTQTRVTCSKY